MQTWEIYPEIEYAETLPTFFYRNESYFKLTKQQIFARSWHFINDETTAFEKGNLYPFTLFPSVLDEPLLLAKDKNGNIRCLSNVCTHRGNILVSECSQKRQIVCGYHARAFGLDGKMKFMPEFKEACDFPRAADNLTNLSLGNFGKLLFTNLKNPLFSFEQLMKPIKERLSWIPFEEFYLMPEKSQSYHINGNWALYCENYLEGFHIPFVHKGLNETLDYRNYKTELFDFCNLQLGIAKDGEPIFDLPPQSVDYGKKVAAYYYFVFPNMMFNFYPWGLSLNIVKPISNSKTQVDFYTYVWKKDKLNKGAGSDLNTVEMEDEAVVENVQRGVQSSFYHRGRYSPKMEKGVHHFHQLLTKFLFS